MSDATSQTAKKRSMPRQDDVRFNLPTTSIHRVEADGVQVFYRARRSLATRIPGLIFHVPRTHSASGQ
jgi:hypothetical protein